MKIILPKTFVDEEKIEYPLFFLAGPNKGGGNWQEKCCLELSKLIPEFFVVVPNQWKLGDKFFQYKFEGKEDKFLSRTAWEHYYLNLAAERSKNHDGCIIFWLPMESKISPREDGQPYARDTYGELGAWRRNAAINKHIRVVVGAEPDFPGLEDIQENFDLDFGQKYLIPNSLEETVRLAVQWCKKVT